MSRFDLVLWIVKNFLLSHLVLIAIPVAIVLVIFFPGQALAFVRTTVGKIVIAMVVAATIGWELRAYLDDSVAIERNLSAEKQAVVEQKQLIAVANKQADEARRQAEAQKATAAEAAAREAQAHDAANALQEQIDDYAADLADAKKHPADERLRCALSDADARRLRSIGAAPTRRP